MDVPEDEWFDVIEDGGLDKAEENEYFDVAGLTEVVKRGSCGEWRKQLLSRSFSEKCTRTQFY
ncbi:unnamed protein product [Gongylonema pulchrum]|uniref:Uncharacterized protein n=1 Tax=Gongylonema pulchrum TaxID=637853 RepID=A0A183DLU1_9BILA|nr:unnamed protein product [Gongylonema pulchrum]